MKLKFENHDLRINKFDFFSQVHSDVEAGLSQDTRELV